MRRKKRRYTAGYIFTSEREYLQEIKETIRLYYRNYNISRWQGTQETPASESCSGLCQETSPVLFGFLFYYLEKIYFVIMDVSDFSPEVDGPPCDVVRHRRFSFNRLVQSFRISTLLRLPGDVIIFEWKSRSAARFHLRGLSPRHKSAHGIHLSGPRATCRVIAPLLYNKFFLLLLVVEIYYIKIKYEENRRKKINKREDVPQHTIITLITIRSRKYVYPNFFLISS